MSGSISSRLARGSTPKDLVTGRTESQAHSRTSIVGGTQRRGYLPDSCNWITDTSKVYLKVCLPDVCGNWLRHIDGWLLEVEG